VRWLCAWHARGFLCADSEWESVIGDTDHVITICNLESALWFAEDSKLGREKQQV
jgi:hypothetical protein